MSRILHFALPYCCSPRVAPAMHRKPAPPYCVANIALIALFALLQVADGVVTYLGLSFASVDEVNPVLEYVAGWFGLGGSISLLKLAGLMFLAFLFHDRHKMRSVWITVTLASAVGFYCWIVAGNVALVVGSHSALLS